MSVGLFLTALVLQADSVRVCVVDQRSGAPLSAVTVTSAVRTRTLSTDCAWIDAGRVQFRRIGYRALVTVVERESVIRLTPLVGGIQLDTQHVVARADFGGGTRTEAKLSVAAARERGATSVPQLVALLPYAQLQSNRGAVGLSLRGARREQVVVTLDGIPLNDPSTGLADVAELPLSAISAAAVSPGASPIDGGPGAVGGVLALESNSAPVVSVRMAAFGERAIEASGRATRSGSVAQFGGSWVEQRNDFRFRNTAGAFELAPLEARINNDQQRLSVFGNVLRGGLRLAAVASRAERGMVGPMNVRTYDHDRAQTDRVLIDARVQRHTMLWSASLRSFGLSYRDESRPALDNDADAHALTVGATGMLGPFSLAAGGGADRVRTSNGVQQDRVRGQLAAQFDEHLGTVVVTAGVRLDAVEHSGVLPSFSLGVAQEWRQEQARGERRQHVRLRVAQAVRVPTLYDLYFASPQRIVLRALRPERVRYDGELASGVAWHHGSRMVLLEGALVARELRDAIIWFPGNFTWSPSNVGLERLHGVEARLQATSGPARLAAWASRYDASITSDRLTIPTPYVSRNSAGAQVGVDVGNVILSSALHALGRRPFTAGPRNPEFELPAVALVDLSLARRSAVSRFSMLVGASLENAFDRSWQSVNGFPEPGRRWSVSLTLTPAPR